jgi:2-polyprenyl-6-methoxyphenol hydroxylase-like FAD-dependent oxidoreductase
VSLIGRFGDFPPTDKQGFLAFADELHSDLAHRIITEAEQLSPIAHHRFVSSVRRHYEQVNSFPEGFLVIGDALCTFNPIYAQGMSAAAKQAKILQDILSEYAEQSRPLSGFAPAFFPKAAEFNSTPWHLPLASTLLSPKLGARGRPERKNKRATWPRWMPFRRTMQRSGT